MPGKESNQKKGGLGHAIKNALDAALKRRKADAKMGDKGDAKSGDAKHGNSGESVKASKSKPTEPSNLLPNLEGADSQASSPAIDGSGKQIPFPAQWPSAPSGGKKPAHKKRGGKRLDGPITKDMLISDVVMTYPDTLPVLIEYGLHCVGCTLSAYDTLESGCKLHGFDDETIDNIIDDMNHELAKKMDEEGQKAKKDEKTEKEEKKG